MDLGDGSLRGVSAFSSMAQLTALHLINADLGGEEPWEILAKLTSLQQVDFGGGASGDPSPLSALTRLSSLYLESSEFGADNEIPFSFSSLQPLSTLQQLEVLRLEGHACAATSLQGLSGLSKLKILEIQFDNNDAMLRSLEGISPGVIECSVVLAPDLVSLAGIESCTSLEKLSLDGCGVSSLQPLHGLSSLMEMKVYGCCLTSLEGLGFMSLHSLSLRDCNSFVQLSGVEHLSTLQTLDLGHCDSLAQLSGIEHLSALTSLVVDHCFGLTSLQSLSQLGEGLQKLAVLNCPRVQEDVLDLPHVHPTAAVSVAFSNVREVVLSGGVRKAVGPPHIFGG
jgi:Leucine-rich repeat (LRR) protein